MSDEPSDIPKEDKSDPLGFIIDGRPIAWARAGYSKGRFYDRQEKERIALKYKLREIYPGEPKEGPIYLGIVFCYKVPKSLPKDTADAMIGTPRIMRPDCDNLIKFIADCAQGILYKDDAQIAEIHSKKVWDERDTTMIIVDNLES
jgi:Holliday junction resolvase RusA-like endonuclease